MSAAQRAFELIPEPPASATALWIDAFAHRMLELKPGLQTENAIRCAMLAHTSTWLLGPDEAAQCWLAAIESQFARSKDVLG